MSELQATVRFKIYSGKNDEFKAIAQKCIEISREKDSGTLQYDWFFNEGETECVVRERYKNSDAVLEHMANLGETLEDLLKLADQSLEVYGAPSEALANASEGMDVKVFDYFQGL